MASDNMAVIVETMVYLTDQFIGEWCFSIRDKVFLVSFHNIKYILGTKLSTEHFATLGIILGENQVMNAYAADEIPTSGPIDIIIHHPGYKSVFKMRLEPIRYSEGVTVYLCAIVTHKERR